MVVLEDTEIEQYITDNYKDRDIKRFKQVMECVVIDIKTTQFCSPFKNKREALEQIDLALEWYMNHIK